MQVLVQRSKGPKVLVEQEKMENELAKLFKYIYDPLQPTINIIIKDLVIPKLKTQQLISRKLSVVSLDILVNM